MSGGMLLTIGVFGVLLGSLMFPATLKLWGKAFALLVHTLKWLMIVGFVVAFLNCPQMYDYVGWTPASLLFGKEIYKNSTTKK